MSHTYSKMYPWPVAKVQVTAERTGAGAWPLNVLVTTSQAKKKGGYTITKEIVSLPHNEQIISYLNERIGQVLTSGETV